MPWGSSAGSEQRIGEGGGVSGRLIDVVTAYGATLARGASGLSVGALGQRPEQPLQLWDFEGCPYCRKVREAASMLDLEMLIQPCPKGGTRFRATAIARGGKAQFPWLVDPNTGAEMYESADIVRYLYATYGHGRPPLALAPDLVATATSALASAWRFRAGIKVRPSRAPDKPLELWSFEASPYCRLVRETLTEFELPYLLHNVAKGSPSREAFVARSGKMQVPFLADPNTGRDLFESAAIVEYLHATYGAAG